jgi:hypothetical protein
VLVDVFINEGAFGYDPIPPLREALPRAMLRAAGLD